MFQTTHFSRKICEALFSLVLRARESPHQARKPEYHRALSRNVGKFHCGPFSPTQDEAGSSASPICSAGSLPYQGTSTLMPNNFIAILDGVNLRILPWATKTKPHGPGYSCAIGCPQSIYVSDFLWFNV